MFRLPNSNLFWQKCPNKHKFQFFQPDETTDSALPDDPRPDRTLRRGGGRAGCGAKRARHVEIHPDPETRRHPAHQRRPRLRRPPGFGIPLHDRRDGRPSDDFLGRGASQRAETRPRNRTDHGTRNRSGRIYRAPESRKCAGQLRAQPEDRRGRRNRAHSADGLEQLELLGARRHAGAGALVGARDGRKRTRRRTKRFRPSTSTNRI